MIHSSYKYICFSLHAQIHYVKANLLFGETFDKEKWGEIKNVQKCKQIWSLLIKIVHEVYCHFSYTWRQFIIIFCICDKCTQVLNVIAVWLCETNIKSSTQFKYSRNIWLFNAFLKLFKIIKNAFILIRIICVCAPIWTKKSHAHAFAHIYVCVRVLRLITGFKCCWHENIHFLVQKSYYFMARLIYFG